ncbi:MAG: DNA repair protein RadA [Bacteroidales bacterium]|nr:DNA repair protein RadA [Bacteroidales bacterium]
MAKTRTAYVCSDCGYDSVKWQGRCPSCGAWNTFKEFTIGKPSPQQAATQARQALAGLDTSHRQPQILSHISALQEARIDLHDTELNRVLGGGLVAGSLTLLGGEPGIGKSTLLLQTMMQLSHLRILYVSGEESERQIKLRADRIRGEQAHVQVVCETVLERIFEHIGSVQPQLLVLDSIQTLQTESTESAPGSVSQIRECAAAILKYAKESGVPVILIGHITKEGSLAGPKVLEHIVDTVLQFEGDRQHLYRLLRSMKNRFGNTSEIGIYEMRSDGLRQVENPSEFLITDTEGLSGVAIACAIEGARPFLIETQALVSTAAYGTPQRSAIGFDARRLNMLLAVLEKRVGFKLGQKDVFLNIAGGLRVSDPAMDLAVIAAIISSNVDVGLARNVCMAGEIGLSGEIRPIMRIEQRIAEAQKLGFAQIVVPQHSIIGLDLDRYTIEVSGAQRVEDALRHLLG